MKIRNLFVAILVVVLLTASTSVVLAKKGTTPSNLGKFTLAEIAVGDVVPFTWAVDAIEPPLWSIYRDDSAIGRGWSGLFHCSGVGCWTQNVDGVWYGELFLNARDFSEGAYMLCAETEYGSATFETWFFRIGAGPAVRADVTMCP